MNEQPDNRLPPLDGFEELKITPKLPIKLYGEFATAYATEIATAYQVSVDMVLAAMFVAVGTALGKKIKIKSDPHENTATMWLAVVARSGYGKTAPISKILAPLREIDESLVAQHRDAYASWKSDGKKGLPPPRRQMILTDSTPEARYELMVHNDNIIIRDELVGLLKDFNRYHQSGEEETMLSIWSGSGISVNRKTSEPVYVKNPFLSIIGGIQPSIVSEAFGGKNWESSGFVARWLFVWMADSKVPEKLSRYKVNEAVVADWHTLINELWRLPEKTCQLGSEAFDEYEQYVEATRRKLNDPNTNDTTGAMLSKMEIYALRFALIIHFLKKGESAGDYIDGSVMEAAVKTCKVFEEWAQMALEAIGTGRSTKPMSNAEVIQEVNHRWGIKNQSQFAECIGISQQAVSKALNN